MIFSCLAFLLIIYNQYTFIRFWLRPDKLESKRGIVNGMCAAICYQFSALTLMFIIFLLAVEFEIDRMMQFFYQGLPAFCFEIALQCYLKSILSKYH